MTVLGSVLGRKFSNLEVPDQRPLWSSILAGGPAVNEVVIGRVVQMFLRNLKAHKKKKAHMKNQSIELSLALLRKLRVRISRRSISHLAYVSTPELL